MPEESVSPSKGHAHPNPELVTETDYSPPRGNPFPIVGIGASAGGLEAFAQLLAAVPPNTGMAFVLVQHLDPQHESLLAGILTPATKMPVVTVHDGIEIEPDHVYVIPPNTSMELHDGTLRLAAREPGLHLPIDIFFRSLAQVQGSRAIGVVFPATHRTAVSASARSRRNAALRSRRTRPRRDSAGCRATRSRRAPSTTFCRPAEIGRELDRLGQHRFLIAPMPGDAASETLPDGDGELRRILGLLQHRHQSRFLAVQAHHHPTPDRPAHDDSAHRDAGRICATTCSRSPPNWRSSIRIC